MKAPSIRKSAIAAAAAVACLGFSVVVAYATIPDGNGVIHACYTTSTGVLRVIDSSVTNCAKKETSLNWNVKGVQGIPGVQGEQGLQGDQGPAGVQGPPGVSHGYLASSSNVDVAQFPATSDVGSISSVPSGTYMIWAQVNIDDGLNETSGNCEMKLNGTLIPNTPTALELKSGIANLTIVSAATLTSIGSTIEVDCEDGDSTSTASVNLSLVAVNALN